MLQLINNFENTWSTISKEYSSNSQDSLLYQFHNE